MATQPHTAIWKKLFSATRHSKRRLCGLKEVSATGLLSQWCIESQAHAPSTHSTAHESHRNFPVRVNRDANVRRKIIFRTHRLVRFWTLLQRILWDKSNNIFYDLFLWNNHSKSFLIAKNKSKYYSYYRHYSINIKGNTAFEQAKVNLKSLILNHEPQINYWRCFRKPSSSRRKVTHIRSESTEKLEMSKWLQQVRVN